MRAQVPDILARIVGRRRAALGLDVLGLPRSEGAAPSVEPVRNGFVDALRAKAGNAVVAEVKMGSPRLGSLEGRVDPLRQARIYRDHGAAALSVVVEPEFFFGTYELLRRCREASGLPALAKDFVVSERQLDAAREAGAEAMLLIAGLYEGEELFGLVDACRRRGLAPLVEIHDRPELETLGSNGAREWELVGVNHRDLRTFEVDLSHSSDLVGELPQSALKVAESGIATRADIETLAARGFDAFLVGESLLLAPDPGASLDSLLGEGGV